MVFRVPAEKFREALDALYEIRYWQKLWQTMESTVYGHPGNPKSGPPMPATLSVLDLAGAGLTFEENGLRARVELERRAAGAK